MIFVLLLFFCVCVAFAITFDIRFQIHPLSGPLEGGTLVTIEGSNLGSSEEEIQDKVTIGGIPCIPVEYSISVR